MNSLIGSIFTTDITKAKKCINSNTLIQNFPTSFIVTNYDNGKYTIRKLKFCKKKSIGFQYIKIDYKKHRRCSKQCLYTLYTKFNIIREHIPIIYNPIICRLPEWAYSAFTRDINEYLEMTYNNSYYKDLKGL